MGMRFMSADLDPILSRTCDNPVSEIADAGNADGGRIASAGVAVSLPRRQQARIGGFRANEPREFRQCDDQMSTWVMVLTLFAPTAIVFRRGREPGRSASLRQAARELSPGLNAAWIAAGLNSAPADRSELNRRPARHAAAQSGMVRGRDLSVPIQQIVTFSADPFGGNPAYVVTTEPGISVPTLQRLCQHLNEPLLAVLVPGGVEIGLRFVTPTGFHPGAGHATHAAAWVALNTLGAGQRSLELRLDTGGHRSVRAEGELISVDWPILPFTDADLVAPLKDVFGVAPLETFSAAFGAIAIFDSEATIAGLKPDMDKLMRLAPDTVMVTAPAQAADFAIRVFAPKLGLPEDPVCGTAHRILVPLWAERIGRRALVSLQLSERGGELFCRLDGDAVTISGRATPFLSGTVALPV
jgi:PhzF family phenazine biosynthesis protein